MHPFPSKKRPPDTAFPCSSNDDTPPSPQPLTGAHTQKRPRHNHMLERPRYVSEKEQSIQLVSSERLGVDVLWPGREDMERGFLGEFLTGEERLYSRGMRFSVLCFLGNTTEHLLHLRCIYSSYPALGVLLIVMASTHSQVANLLRNLNAHIFGVLLSAPPPNSSPLPISISTHPLALTNLNL